MRWRRSKFALFAVAAIAAGVLAIAPPPAHAAAAATATLVFWRGQEGALQPSGNTTLYVSVSNTAGTSRPTGKVVVNLDGTDRPAMDLKHDDPDDARASTTDDFAIDLGTAPHYFVTKYQGDDDTFSPSNDELGLATASMTADPEPSQEGELVTYTFTMSISDKTPLNRRPNGRVAFSDDDGHASESPRQLNDLKATWTVGQRQGRWRTTAIYSRGDDFFQPTRAVRDHNVTSPPTPSGGTANNGTTATTKKATATTKPKVSAKSATTAALAPISPATSTTLTGESSTSETFGSFPTTPPSTSDLNALGSKKRNDGPPLAVVVMTLGALGVLGGVAAIRRYRRSSTDWF